jgi:UDP-N-acetylmuramate dehydrogenase
MLSGLPEVNGRYTENAALGAKGWFRCGGTADVLFKPANQDDLQYFLQNCPVDVPVHIFGAMSNSIIRDWGLRGVTIRLGREFSDIHVDGNRVTAGALALDANVAQIAAENGVGGLEFLSGIPGSIGGALRMNAGCYGVETKDVLVECQALDRQGNLHRLTPDQMGMSYRHVEVPQDYIFLNATFQGEQESPDIVQERMVEIKEKREQSQPIREKTGGSTFANPSVAELTQAGLSGDMKVWQLIDKVGGRGLKIGGAQMSEKHCNFMINKGTATAADLEALGEEIRTRVIDAFGIELRWEIKRIGEK